VESEILYLHDWGVNPLQSGLLQEHVSVEKYLQKSILKLQTVAPLHSAKLFTCHQIFCFRYVLSFGNRKTVTVGRICWIRRLSHLWITVFG